MFPFEHWLHGCLLHLLPLILHQNWVNLRKPLMVGEWSMVNTFQNLPLWIFMGDSQIPLHKQVFWCLGLSQRGIFGKSHALRPDSGVPCGVMRTLWGLQISGDVWKIQHYPTIGWFIYPTAHLHGTMARPLNVFTTAATSSTASGGILTLHGGSAIHLPICLYSECWGNSNIFQVSKCNGIYNNIYGDGIGIWYVYICC